MDQDARFRIVRACFAHVDVERIFVEHSPRFGYDIVKVIVPDDQLAAALRNGGAHAEQAARESGSNLEVVPASRVRAAERPAERPSGEPDR